ncbi:RDD family protein [Cellulomonas sp. Leaf334]|uniref:RDD family protein n=1 Tax=Cellulomonas sp. Leaf334 TaxID=1736339 RepID=UPI0006FE2E03|nr:RDD family protein [Cellulomonas sp. Leaf334]KQR11916.1 hypothetical protein ASF78_11995 [Cellulomonas sp. Leaf334]
MTDTEVLPPDLAPPADGPPLASWLRRVVAALLDGSILGGATWIVLGPGGSGPSLTPTFDVDATGGVDVVGWFTSPWLVGLLVAMLALQGWTGATPGKRVAGVAVVRVSDGLPVGFLASALRVVAHVLDAIFLIGYLRPLWNARKQTFADSIVGTLAVETREPPAHPWFARFRRERSVWRSAVVNVAAIVVCALGVAFSASQTTTGSVQTSDVPCVEGVQTATASVAGSREVLAYVDQRLWLTRPSTDLSQTRLSIGWTWYDTDLMSVDRMVATDILDADGQVVTEHEQEPGARSIAVLDPVTIEAADLENAGRGWTVESRLVSNGATVASCMVSQEDWDSAGQG